MDPTFSPFMNIRTRHPSYFIRLLDSSVVHFSYGQFRCLSLLSSRFWYLCTRLLDFSLLCITVAETRDSMTRVTWRVLCCCAGGSWHLLGSSWGPDGMPSTVGKGHSLRFESARIVLETVDDARVSWDW